ncbi:hypothetical protein GBF38_013215 [Nibea albiflora]|uniref:Uncharacterized protein n=1 Tax=Nibea albiflora TaxID=240163 RepID=A0ACB7F097_NIBAL|nr:hypothetical protein GBF38_013215 [Nibea albiflora]
MQCSTLQLALLKPGQAGRGGQYGAAQLKDRQRERGPAADGCHCRDVAVVVREECVRGPYGNMRRRLRVTQEALDELGAPAAMKLPCPTFKMRAFEQDFVASQLVQTSFVVQCVTYTSVM